MFFIFGVGKNGRWVELHRKGCVAAFPGLRVGGGAVQGHAGNEGHLAASFGPQWVKPLRADCLDAFRG